MERTAVPAQPSLRCKINDVYGLHKGYMLTLRPGYTALVGPNGAGKTTLLDQLADVARKRKYTMIRYSDMADGRGNAMQMDLLRGNMARLATAACSSEGQKIAMNFSGMVGRIGAAVRSAVETGAPLLVLLDSIDSGTSIDRHREFMGLFDLIERDAGVYRKGGNGVARPVYVVAAVNAYELATRRCIDVRTGRYVTFADYLEYACFICDYFKTHPDPEKRTNIRPAEHNTA